MRVCPSLSDHQDRPSTRYYPPSSGYCRTHFCFFALISRGIRGSGHPGGVNGPRFSSRIIRCMFPGRQLQPNPITQTIYSLKIPFNLSIPFPTPMLSQVRVCACVCVCVTSGHDKQVPFVSYDDKPPCHLAAMIVATAVTGSHRPAPLHPAGCPCCRWPQDQQGQLFAWPTPGV